MSGDIFGCPNWEEGVLLASVSRGQGCWETPYNAQDSPSKRIIQPKMSIVPRLRSPALVQETVISHLVLSSLLSDSLLPSFFPVVYSSQSSQKEVRLGHHFVQTSPRVSHHTQNKKQSPLTQSASVTIPPVTNHWPLAHAACSHTGQLAVSWTRQAHTPTQAFGLAILSPRYSRAYSYCFQISAQMPLHLKGLFTC